MTFKLLVPDTIVKNVVAAPGSQIVYYSPELPIPVEHHDAQGIVIWGGRLKWLLQTASELKQLRWVQGLAAGPDAILKAGFVPEAILTNGVGLHNSPVTEHALALLLAASRSLPAAAASQAKAEWNHAIGGLEDINAPKRLSSIRGSHIVIWGYGSIARTLTAVLQQLGATVSGVASRARTEGEVKVVATNEIDGLLPNTDALIMLLPSTPETDNVLDRRRMQLLPKHAWVINVGRGNSINEVDLDAALRAGDFAGAAIDVTKIEPLPADSPLWKTPNLIITPHAAGGRPVEPELLIQENLKKLLLNQPMENVVTRKS
ncbi:MAG: NAD(P)-dependent oxidoreductase [Microbacteriaceae bacterium]